MQNQTNSANATNSAPLSATVEYYPKNGPVIKQQITRRPNEKNFVDAVGRFEQQHKLNPNHLIEKWYPGTQTIQLFETDNPPHTEGTCF